MMTRCCPGLGPLPVPEAPSTCTCSTASHTLFTCTHGEHCVQHGHAVVVHVHVDGASGTGRGPRPGQHLVIIIFNLGFVHSIISIFFLVNIHCEDCISHGHLVTTHVHVDINLALLGVFCNLGHPLPDLLQCGIITRHGLIIAGC